MVMQHVWRLMAVSTILLTVAASACAENGSTPAKTWLDPITRYIHVTYKVPANAPDAIDVQCAWSTDGGRSWNPARVTPLISETAMDLAANEDKDRWIQGLVTERRAAGLMRTVIFDPYPEAQKSGLVDAFFRIQISASGKELSTQSVHLRADNTDVTYLTDWSKVLQKHLIAASPTAGKWLLSSDPKHASSENHLSCTGNSPIPSLTYPLDLKGTYAIFVSTIPEDGSISLRLSGDERTERMSSSKHEQEMLWRWARLDWQHLVVKQRYTYTGYAPSSLAYIKLVPLTGKTEKFLNAKFSGKHDKFLGAYFEPYSWAFMDDIRENYQHREPLTAYKEAGVDLVDTQLARFGMKAVFETRKSDQLLYSTEGDPIGDTVPVTDNVGRMQQYTNTLEAELKYAKELRIGIHANFGATACYVGSALEGDFSSQHPNWRRNDSLLLSVPEVREYMLRLYREALEIGAPGISIDFCRYPDGVDSADDCNKLMRGMRKLADEFGRARGNHVTILVRLPSTGTRKWDCFDYRTWAREGLVDYLCPSNIQGVYQFFDPKPYLDAVKGTNCKFIPEMDGCEWGPRLPGELLNRAKQLYDAGADGVYIYQADGVINSSATRRYLSLLRSSEAVDRWLKNDAEKLPHCSKGIYITKPADSKRYGFYDRLRIWVEGVKVSEMEIYLDGKLINKLIAPPYILATEGYESDKVISPGNHTLLIRVKDGTGWLEQKFDIIGQ